MKKLRFWFTGIKKNERFRWHLFNGIEELWHQNLMEFGSLSGQKRTDGSFRKVDLLWWRTCKQRGTQIPVHGNTPLSPYSALCILISHSYFSYLLLAHPNIPPHTSCLDTIGKFQSPFPHPPRQIPFLITDAFQSRHHYIFRPISFQMHRNPSCWFPRVPFSSPVMLLLVCFCLSLLRESTLLFIFCLSDLCVDGIHRAHLLFFTFL